ncbi:hypothetical protein AYO38_07220 [bacterium SCGC AG-212-C10]|nr:hypothetical protein AYO38_07220 [bacterium SCGC AG-212-C10]
MAGEAAKRYAQAVFEIAVESGDFTGWRSYLDDVATVLTESQVATYFADAKTPLDERLAAVSRVLDLPEVALNFARVLVANGRSRDARAVEKAYTVMADAHAGIVHAQLTTAVPLDQAQVSAIESQLGAALGKSVHATAVVDPTVIGGIIVRVGDKLIDGSVRSRLKLLRRDLASGVAIAPAAS